MDASRVALAALALATLPPAVPLAEVSPAPLGCTADYMIAPDGHLSGRGKLWEYYHFLIDFAPRVIYELRGERCRSVRIHAPGWFRDERFSFTLSSSDRSMAGLAKVLFVRHDITMVPYRMSQPPSFTWLPFNTSSWSGVDQPAVWYTHFRDYARRLAGVGDAEASRGHHILVIRRGNPEQGNGTKKRECHRVMHCGTAALRRHLPEEFFSNVSGYLTRVRWPHRVLQMDGMSLLDQVRVFARARVIVGIHGAGLANMVFASPGSVVIELGKRANYCYKRLADKMGLRHFYIPSKTVTDRLLRTLEKAVGFVRAEAMRSARAAGQGPPSLPGAGAHLLGPEIASTTSTAIAAAWPL